jgi:Kef-type K+ transport system membrane component KefB/mannitol/fructose-specific phosphotransferase system IIA component (Ntr-type)
MVVAMIDNLVAKFSEYTLLGGDMDPMLLIVVVLIAGAMGGRLAKFLHVPVITGNILGGILMGPSCLKIINSNAEFEALQPITTLAMGIITVSIGGHLSYRRLHNALRRILSISLIEVICSVTIVVFVAKLFHASWPLALLLGVISAATAPATTVAVVRENRAKGPFVKTLLSVVAIDNILCIVLFVIVRILIDGYYLSKEAVPRLDLVMLRAGLQLIGSVIIGLATGHITERLVRHAKFHNFSTVLFAVMFCTSVSSYIGLSPLLTSLFFGVYLGNSSLVGEEQLNVLEPIEPLLYICFFTMAGASLHIDSLLSIGPICIAYFFARFAGKAAGAMAGGWFARCSQRIWKNIPLALLPQAGVAIGLVVLIEGDELIPETLSKATGAIIIAAVTINEIIGPFLTRQSLGRSGERDKDRPRLVEFLHEEFIVTDLKAFDKWDAFRQLVDLLYRTHRVEHVTPEELYASVVERKKELSTSLGHGVAIPHGRIKKGMEIQGVLGIFRDGVDYDLPDGKLVEIIMLIVTPEGHEDRHLQVMSSLSAMVSDPLIRTRLVAARDANDAWEVIEGEDTRNYNYFLGDQ